VDTDCRDSEHLYVLWQTHYMTGRDMNGAAGHFGRQMKKERLARGWTLLELAQRTDLDAAHLGRVESGKRPPTTKVAAALDAVFPERRGYFSEWLDESQNWPEIPATFKSWSDYEDKTETLRDWTPSIVTGLLQTEDYARTLLSVQDISQETMTVRLANRMERQQRVLGKDKPPASRFIVDELSLYREVGSPAKMAAQLGHMLELAATPKITIQVLPAIAHPANASGFLLADHAVWVEHVTAGYVFTDPKTLTTLASRFDSLREECYRVSESTALLERMAAAWATGASPLTRTEPAATA
jgi:transcriptional regulator with XRE-family HTH domain